jgi:GWxTD domain-containing protein
MKVNKRHFWTIVLIIISVAALCAVLPAQQKKTSVKDLPPQYQKWLQEEVVYIITSKERDVFLQLESDRERNIFIEAFWKQRNPDPNSAENAFKVEHYKRLAYANQWLGKNSPTQGWRTDRGRIWILLGQPKEIQAYENMYDLRPVITWFYDGMAEYGLPGSFYVVFWKKDIVDDYRLYSPINDGPQQLMQHYMGDMTDATSAYQALMRIEPAVATVSLSLIPGEAQYSMSPSLASEILIKQSIPDAPHVKVKDEYAEKLLKYKNIIEVDYTANYIDNESLISVFQDPSGMSFVHYLIEPKRLTFEQTANGYHTALEITGRVSDMKDQSVYQFDRSIPLDMSEPMMAQIKARFFSLQDLFPVTPGQYKINLLLKNRLSREFTSVEAVILVPEPAAFSMSPPVLAYKTDRESRFKGQNKSFLLGGVQFVPSPRNAFAADDTLSLYFQLHGIPAELRANGAVQYTIERQTETMKLPEKVKTVTRNLREIPDPGNIFEEFPLGGMTPSHYTITVAVLDASQAEKLKARVDYDIRGATTINRAWVLSLPQPPTSDPTFANIIGAQLLAKKDLAKARPLLEQAFRRDPSNPKFALDYVRALIEAKDFRAVGDVAKPFLADERRYDFLEFVGAAAQEIGTYAEAIVHYKDYLAHFGTNIAILNAVGECHQKLGNAAEALVAWEKSLQIEPNQPALKDKVRALKDKK